MAQDKVIKTNYHTHTFFCDGLDSPKDLCKEAIAKDFTHLGLSSHSLFPFSSEGHIHPLKHTEYLFAVAQCKEDYKDKLNILCGFEAEYIPGVCIPNIDIARQKIKSLNTNSINPTTLKDPVNSINSKVKTNIDLDYLIGSVHYIPCKTGIFAVDGKKEDLQEGINKGFNADGKALVQEYFALEKELLQKGKFTILAHIDLVRKYNLALNFFDPRDSWYKSEIKALAKQIKKAGIITEINMGAIYRAKLKEPYPTFDFLCLLQQNNIPITLSSDCHNKKNLDACFDIAKKLAKKAGYKELAYLEGGHSGEPELLFYAI